MKRILLAALAALLILTPAFSENVYTALVPKNAKTMGMGGVFASVPTAEFSFFGNPADFAAKKASYTLTSVDAWMYAKPTSANIATFLGAVGNIENNYKDLLGLMADNGGIGGGAAIGLSAFAGKGFGFGVFFVTDEYIDGVDIPSASLTTDSELSAVIGLGIPLELGPMRLNIGGDIRPFYRARAAGIGLASIVTALDESMDFTGAIDDISAGFGLAADLGATLELGSLTFGASIRDLAPSFNMWNGALGDLISAIQSTGLPEADETYSVSFQPTITAGLSWKPQLLPGFLEPSVYCELQDIVSVVKDWEGAASALNLLHAGAEVEVLNFIYLRGGLNRGWLSLGVGAKLLFVDVNAAVFTEELGAVAGDNPRSGVALQAAIRF